MSFHKINLNNKVSPELIKALESEESDFSDHFGEAIHNSSENSKHCCGKRDRPL